MKVYATSNDAPTCLSDVLKKIVKIEVVDDVRDVYCVLAQMPQALFAAEDIETDPEYDQQEEDLWYLGYEDSDLVKVSPDIIHKFRNEDLLLRVWRLNKKLLTVEQQEYLKSQLKIKDRTHNEVTDADIKYLLSLIKSCNKIDYDLLHDKTNEFTFDKNENFREGAVRRVLKFLTVDDWMYRTRSINYNYFGNTLFIFNPDVSWLDKYGKTHYLKIYIKLDVSKSSSKTGIALVSFHGEDD